jgi:arginyl-tRNA synthetase
MAAMKDPLSSLEAAFRASIVAAFGPEFADADPLVGPSTNPDFGDYQANAAMGLAKRLKQSPQATAQAIIQHLDAEGLAGAPEIAGPGFINLRLDSAYLSGAVETVAADERAGARAAKKPLRVVVDYSCPNVAKEMHVGHLRSTIIGDSIARVLGFLGHEVIRQNHLGDWGTQFGMLIERILDQGWEAGSRRSIGDLNELYREAKARFDTDPAFAERARARVVALQAGDGPTLDLWRALIDESKRHFAAIYSRLGVLLEEGDYRGESFYNPLLADTARELEEIGAARLSEGALCLFPPGFEGPEGQAVPLIVRKSDGGYGYDATDLAALRYRVRELGAERLIYVTDSRQKQHFAMVFAGAAMAGWLPEGRSAEHVPFGSVLGEDGKPFKTRAGENVKLADLLEEAERRAYELVKEKETGLGEEEMRRVARAIGIGAVKYADLSSDRIKDYVFDWRRMLSFDGNTAPYLQNAYVRIRSIFRKAEAQGALPGRIAIASREEHLLGLELLKFGPTVEAVARSLEPHRLCGYLYNLASLYHRFYEACPVLTAPDPQARASRLGLCAATAKVISLGLGLLGIETVERM